MPVVYSVQTSFFAWFGNNGVPAVLVPDSGEQIMNQCECLAKCPFFNDRMTAMPAMVDIYKRNYCQGESSSCARHEVFSAFGPSEVPADLYPNQNDRAASLIAARAY